MFDRTTIEPLELSGRLKELDQITGTLLARRTPEVVEDLAGDVSADLPEVASRGLVPVPRRSRIFLRHGEGHGTFAEVTITAPPVRHTTD